MIFNIVASGSKGNATLVKSKNTLILIDMGISLTRLNEGLDEISMQISDISAAIFTHSHADHISGMRFLSPKIIYGTEGTIVSSLNNFIAYYDPFKIGDFTITAFPTSHDAKQPCGYLIEADGEKLVYMTDTGIVLDEVYSFIKNPDYLIIECNHDIKMLMNTNRPIELKNRILGEQGHLCNEVSAIACKDILGEKTKQIYLAHISEEANTPELALKAYQEIFATYNIDINKYEIKVANQWCSTHGGNPNEY